MWHGHSDNDMESLGNLTFLEGETECKSGMIEYDLHAVIFVIIPGLESQFLPQENSTMARSENCGSFVKRRR